MNKGSLVNKNVFFFNYLTSQLVGYVLLVLSLTYSFYCNFFGLDFTDSFAFLNSVISLKKTGTAFPLTYLSTYIGLFIYNYIGQSVIVYRIISWLILLLSLYLPICLVKRNKRTEYVIIASIITIIYTAINSNIFGYTRLTDLLVVLVFISLYLYFKKRSLTLIISLAIFSAIATSIRFPNILVAFYIPSLISLLYLKSSDGYSFKKMVFHIGLYLLAFTLAYLFMIVLFANFNSNEIAKISNGVNTTHSFLVLLKAYLRDIIKIAKYFSLLLMGFFLWKIKLNKFLKLTLCSFFILLLIYLLYFKIIVGNYSSYFSLFLLATSIFILGGWFIETRKNRMLLIVFSVFLLAFVPAIGSNTGLIKARLMVIFIPLICVNIQQLDLKKYIVVLFVVLIPFSIVRRINASYEDSPIYLSNASLDQPTLKHIKTTTSRKKYLNRVSIAYNHLDKKGYTVIFYGKLSHLFNYLTKNAANPFYSFWMKSDDIMEIKIMQDVIRKNKVAVIYVPEYPEKYKLNSNLTLIENAIINENYRQINLEDFKVFIPNK